MKVNFGFVSNSSTSCFILKNVATKKEIVDVLEKSMKYHFGITNKFKPKTELVQDLLVQNKQIENMKSCIDIGEITEENIKDRMLSELYGELGDLYLKFDDTDVPYDCVQDFLDLGIIKSYDLHM